MNVDFLCNGWPVATVIIVFIICKTIIIVARSENIHELKKIDKNIMHRTDKVIK